MALFDRSGVERVPNAERKGRPAYRYTENCYRCGGLGGSDGWKHTGWTCYQCGGSGAGPVRVKPLYEAEQLAKLVASQAKRDEKRRAKEAAEGLVILAERAAKREAFAAANPDVVSWIAANDKDEGFANDLACGIESYGSLTENQIAAVRKCIERDAAKAASRFVGTVGERREFTLTVDRRLDFQISRFPLIVSYTNICRDADGNAVLYKGSQPWERGETVRVKATVKGHTEYRGVLQTIIQRPKRFEEQS